MAFLGTYNYWIFITLMMIGLYIVIVRGNLVKKIIGLNIFQSSVFLFFISVGKVSDGTAPIILHDGGEAIYSNPLPHVLILTAIVVAVSTSALALALIVRIHESYGTLQEELIHEAERAP
ncbi:MAG: cation:proton antiporter subunit C [Alphaproteobacteria bacterium]|jgi:multicomponent Na+:H+ antiporter subunit C|nr:cation:proton antiporter subunit C [Alphaproteobacteria bacterium]MBT4710116.1 cation:proton antiporter subunit C [Alphaproteobacteria bacterium]